MNAKQFLVAACVAMLLANCSRNRPMNDQAELTKFAQRYAEAWCSQDPEKVAAFYAKGGSITVNGASPVAIAEVARGFMRDFPNMVVTFDKLENAPNGIGFHWTFTGTNTGPGGTGKRVRISGYELWKIDSDGLIGESKGHFDAAEYERQLKDGVDDEHGSRLDPCVGQRISELIRNSQVLLPANRTPSLIRHRALRRFSARQCRSAGCRVPSRNLMA